MRRGFEALCFLVVAGTLAVTALGRIAADSPISATIDVHASDLLVNPVGGNWPSYNGDYSGRRYSALTQIDTANVKNLRVEWVFHSPNSSSMEVTPLAINGVLLVTSANDAFALDARTGRIIWHYSRPISEGLIDDASSHHSRGAGVWRSRVYMETDNAHLLCLDSRSGNLVWDVQYADSRKNYGATSAPLVVNNKVIVGTSGGDDGVRGFIAAFDTMTGNLVWRFWTIPGPGEPGSSSWPGNQYWLGGGTAWMPGTYDPQLNTLYWGTSNPSPDFDGSVRPGDDLYTDCVLALDPDSGKLKWHFQFTPHDLFDYDATETPVLIDAAYRGKPRKLLVEANRNGFLYVLDRTSGRFLTAERFAENLNWADGINASGRPMRTKVAPSAKGTLVCPGYVGATNWYAPSFNPRTGLFYFMAVDDCNLYYSKPEQFKPGQTYYATGTGRLPAQEAKTVLRAYSLETHKFQWSYPQVGSRANWSGTMTTAGGLVFFGDPAGYFEAVDARDGKPLWHFNTGQRIHASPMTFAAGGRQYVAIAAGSDIFAFALLLPQ